MDRGVWNGLGRATAMAPSMGLGAAGADIGLAGCHGARPAGCQAGGALAGDGERRHALAQTGGQADPAGRVAPGRGVAEDDLVDRARLGASCSAACTTGAVRLSIAGTCSRPAAEGRATRCNDV
jgi:hypothetical protein